jgi:23S rRNA maturation-related 3'-5' exoribonuclease YhaM
MDNSGFYIAPASTKYHGAVIGALAEHSLNVYNAAMNLANAWLDSDKVEELRNSIIICSLLHDLGKAGQYNKPLYVENVLKTGVSKAQPFKTNEDLMTLDHEIVSVIEASRFITLTEEEQFAIAFHNGLYTSIGRYGLQGKETPLQMIIHFSDLWASRVMEKGA